MSGDHSNYCINEIGQNIEKSPRDLRRLSVTNSSKRLSANVDVKNSQGVIIMIIFYRLFQEEQKG